uniref:Uncharacterized protein n=1 Tax=Strombidium inclinatum TaxID=197538 RepID=A0A7S3III8_9SPIT
MTSFRSVSLDLEKMASLHVFHAVVDLLLGTIPRSLAVEEVGVLLLLADQAPALHSIYPFFEFVGVGMVEADFVGEVLQSGLDVLLFKPIFNHGLDGVRLQVLKPVALFEIEHEFGHRIALWNGISSIGVGDVI